MYVRNTKGGGCFTFRSSEEGCLHPGLCLRRQRALAPPRPSAGTETLETPVSARTEQEREPSGPQAKPHPRMGSSTGCVMSEHIAECPW